MDSPRTDFQAVLRDWRDNPELGGELVYHRVEEGRRARFGQLSPALPGELEERLAARGVERLYRHQAKAVNLIRRGGHLAVAAGTASGKSLCYQLPIAEAILEDPSRTALLIFPTKALAQDQARSLREWDVPGLVVATYDGDLPPPDRPRVRNRANAVLTNPDMLHYSILPHHRKWSRFLSRLSYVVVDEMHYLKGMFGSHTALVLRRLRRLADHYRASPTFVFTSATIGNPQELARRLSGLDVAALQEDDSPSGERVFALWNPPLEDPESGERRSAQAETTDLLVDLVGRRVNTIAFARSRKGAELVFRWASRRLGPLGRRIASYRAGYTAADRRRIEENLFSGNLLGITTTNALELGIDVGGLDAALISSFPGTLSSFRQQAGRAGRNRGASLVTLVGGNDALDQYFMHHPQELFTRPPEAAVVNPENPTVLNAHAGCAAYELPLRLSDRRYLGEGLEESVRSLVGEGKLRQTENRIHWVNGKSPAHLMSLRTAGDRIFTIYDLESSRPMGNMERERAFRDAHQGAIYLHQGDDYLVEKLDLEKGEIGVRRATVDFHTEPKVDDYLDVTEESAPAGPGEMGFHLGKVVVSSQVKGFRRQYPKRKRGPRTEYVPLDLPENRLETQAFWFTFPHRLIERAGVHQVLPGALHAAEHTLIAMMPLFAICDRSDIGGLSTPLHPDTNRSSIFIYDGYPGGAGIAPAAYRVRLDLMEAALSALRRCPCASGCPSCVQSPKCGNWNEPLSKKGAVRLLNAALHPA